MNPVRFTTPPELISPAAAIVSAPAAALIVTVPLDAVPTPAPIDKVPVVAVIATFAPTPVAEIAVDCVSPVAPVSVAPPAEVIAPQTVKLPVSAQRVDRLIRELSDKLGVTSIVVSHDLTSIFSIADKIAMIYKGTFRKIGTPAEFRATDDPVVRQFVNGLAEGPMEV